ncbi:MAG: hypothetical protein Kilf2KO_14310 [Rhodospirillales bacterium]
MFSAADRPNLDGKAIVTKIDRLPPPTAFTVEMAKKTKAGLDLEVHVLAETLPGPGLMKRGYVKPNIATFGAFELHCDEGEAIGGGDRAPAPLSYLAAGVAFCLLTHLQGYADAQGLKTTALKVEQRMKFQSRIPGMTAEMGGQMEGHAMGLETFVIVESEEAPEAIARMVEVAGKACMAAQAVVTAVPAAMTVICNGERL